MKRARKPAWLRLMAPAGNQYGYHARRCNCGRWLFQTRDQCQWEDWDAGLLVGDDVVTAILCHRMLCRVTVSDGPPLLSTVWAGIGIDADGRYLARHDCMLPTIGHTPYRPSRKPRKNSGTRFLPACTPCGDDPWAAHQRKEKTDEPEHRPVHQLRHANGNRPLLPAMRLRLRGGALQPQ